MLLERKRGRRFVTQRITRRVSESRDDSRTHSVSRHDLCPADGLCVQSLVLCERFKWEINIKRPFMAPSNKQLDSSFCFASLLRSLASTQPPLGVFLLGFLLEDLRKRRRFDATCKSVKAFRFYQDSAPLVPNHRSCVRLLAWKTASSVRRVKPYGRMQYRFK